MTAQDKLQNIEDLLQQGNKNDALEQYKILMSDAQGGYEIWVNYAAFLYRCKQYEEAITISIKSLDMQPSAEGYHNLGSSYDKIGRQKDAITAYKCAIALNPEFVQSHNNIAAIFENMGKLEQAIDHYQIATNLSPKKYLYWCNLARVRQNNGRFNEALTALRFAYALGEDKNNTLNLYANLFKEFQGFEYNAQLSKEIIQCLNAPNMNKGHLSDICRKLYLHPTLIENLTLDIDRYNAMDSDDIMQDVALDWSGLNKPEFISLLANFIIQDPIYEDRLTAIRALCLMKLNNDNTGKTLWDKALIFITSLSCQCFINEYIFKETKEESDAIDNLERRIIGGQNLTLYDIAIYACYRPLHKLPRSNDLMDKLASQEVISAMITLQLAQPLKEIELKKDIKSLTSIDDDISKIVKEQYEQNPYPRWVSTSIGKSLPIKNLVQYILPHIKDNRFSYINNERPRILIAGCGTGKQPIETALTYQGSDLLAIDLSASSIAYAKRKTNEFNINNIEYGLADILKIEELGEKFDAIQCGGVLHHMHNPIAGWRALYNVLKPGGFMFIALYSDIARRDIVAAREFIDKHNYDTSIKSIRSCRDKIKRLPNDNPAKSVINRSDFYTTSACRDLIFHVQEKRYNAIEIKNNLDELGLEFLGFQLGSDDRLERYISMFPDDPNGLNLDNWDIFEQSYPDTFKSMYQFWLQKPMS